VSCDPASGRAVLLAPPHFESISALSASAVIATSEHRKDPSLLLPDLIREWCPRVAGGIRPARSAPRLFDLA
jgi:hypothetical protein